LSDFTTGKIAAQDGIRIAYRDYAPRSRPSALPVVCLHGLTRNVRDFEALAPHLAATRRVVAFSMRGRGESDWDPNPANYNPGVYVLDVMMALTALGIERAVVIGTSLGGLMAMTMATVRPTLLAGVVLNDVGPVVEPSGLARIGTYVGNVKLLPDWAAATAATRAVNGEAFPDYAQADWETMARRLYREKDGGVIADYDPAIAAPFKAPNGATPAPDLWPMFRALKPVPLLAIRGALSDILSAETLARMGVEHGAMQTLTLANRGHAPSLDEPESRAAIDRFLAPL
jgi:pimeloyl-ACP methyl ester carboxylesterase